MARHGEAVSRQELLRAAVCDAIVGARTIDVHITALRHKIGPAGPHIKAVRGVGYRFQAPEPPTS
jgi:DNA-binding response OmpR family regulator